MKLDKEFKEDYENFYKHDIKAKRCSICKKPFIPALECKDSKKEWNKHSFKRNCKCGNKDTILFYG